ncbi:MAG TPA: Rrf2 family transcriptional regulator [Gemmatimonadales bacterium]
MLSNTADYALRAILVLAHHHGGRPVRAEEIADATGAPRNYLAKTLNALAKAGIVDSTRGPAGGFCLAVAPERLTLARVVDLFDAPRAHTCCMLGDGPCDPRQPCAVHHRWAAVTTARRAPLVETTVADLLGTPAAEPRAVLVLEVDSAA